MRRAPILLFAVVWFGAILGSLAAGALILRALT
jgi:hypothetical protein